MNLAVLLILNAASNGLRAACTLAGACADHLDRALKRARSTKDF